MDIEDEIRDALGVVEAAFSGLDIDEWLRCFHPNRVIVLPGMVLAPRSAKECEEVLKGYLDKLRSEGYNRSNLDRLNVRRLTDTTAIASTVWSRFSDASLIERTGATYMFIKTDNKWLIAMVTTHPDNA